MLVLCDVNGTLCYRDWTQPKATNGETNTNFTKRGKNYIYLRPGARDFIRRMQSHPRVQFGLYTSMKPANMQGMAEEITGDAEDIKPFHLFDENYCTSMQTNLRLRPLMENSWATYRDLNKIIASDYCR